jgi:tRNA-dihydrouridine synthase A
VLSESERVQGPTLGHRLSVAPMMERTDRHCRFLLRLVAPRVRLYTEMITARALLYGDRNRLLEFHPREHPVALQLGGSDPGELASAARYGTDAGYDEINLNVGCPSGRVQAGCFGAALMLDPLRVAECIAAIRAATSVPVTVKTRLGVDESDSYEFLHAFATAVVGAGTRTLIVHARKALLSGLSPKQNREIPPLDYARVHRLKREFPHIEVVINGGFADAVSVRSQLAHVDGVMIGRAAYDDPMLLFALDPPASKSSTRSAMDAHRNHVVREYYAYVESQLDRRTPVRAMTRHLMGVYNGARGARSWRRGLSELPDGTAGLRRLRSLIEERTDRDCNGDGEAATMAAPQANVSNAR